MDYKNGKIYKIVDNAYTKMYIGSTTQPLSKRFYCHKNNYFLWKNGKHNKTTVYNIFDEFGINNCKIELIINYPCNSKDELEKKEGEYIKNNECVNKCIPRRTKKEYYEDNKDKLKEYYLKRYSSKKKDILEYHKRYYYNNINLISKKLKIYSDSHKNEKAIYDKLYRKKKKDIIYKKNICVCGGSYSLNSYSSHIKTKLHLSYKSVYILQEDFDIIFEMDSIFKLPRTYDFVIRK